MDHTRAGSSRGSSVEATQVSSAYVAELFEYFIYAITMKHILALYREMCRALNLRSNRLPEFYPILKAKLGKNWRADGIFKKLDAKIANNIYGKNMICRDTRVLVIGAGPCGLRVAIECQLLGAKVVVVEKRDRMSRHNVLHLWPFVVEDLIGLGAKRYFPRFCSGPIDHISIRQLQYMLLKVALLLGVEFFEGVAFEELLEPTVSEDGESKGWRARVSPNDHPVAQYEFDVLIGADGKRNTLKGFKRSEFRGKLAIGITVNFIHHRTQLEASVPELSGRSYHFHQDYFNELTEKTGIELENIVYYKGDTHYFVMTAKKNSLLRRKVLKEDFAEVSKLLSVGNVDNNALLEFARDAARYAVNYKLPLNDFALNHYLEPDCALFDFTTFYAAENACVVFELKGYSLLCQLVGDSLLEPFWPTGSGCARGFLSALDAAWQIRSWGMTNNIIHPVDLIAERESLYKFLPYTDPNNMCSRVNKYTIDPTTRYLTKDRKEMPLARCKALYQSDDPAPMEAPRAGKRLTNLEVSENVLLQWAGRQEDLEINEESMPSIVLKIMRLYRPDLLPRCPTYANAVSVLATKFNIAPLCSNADKAAMMKYVCKIYNIFKGEVPHIPVHSEKDILQQIRSRPTSAPKYSVQTSVISKSSDKDRKPRKRRNKMSEEFSVESSPKKKLYSKGRVKKLAAELADQKEPAKLSKQKPKDLLRAIGKIEPSDWHLRQIEKKIRDNQLGRPMPKKAERVPQWDRVQFLERQQRLKEVDTPPGSTAMPTEVKYKDLPDQGTKKVASLADKFRQSNDTPDKQNSTSEKVKAWVGPRVQNVRCVICKKVVFHAESANADGVQLHKNCFRCIICNTNLRPGNFRVQRCTESPTGPVKIFCLKHSSEPIRAPPPRISSYVRPLPRDPIPEPIPTPPPEQDYVSMEISSPTTSKRLSWTGMTSSTTPPRECDEDEWTDLNNLASDMFMPNSDEDDDDDNSTDDYEDAVSEEEENAHPNMSPYTPESLLLIRPRHDPTDSTAGYDDISDDGGSSSGASCSRMREALEARRREVPPAVEMLGTSDSSEEVESEDDDELSDEESSATEVSTDSEFAREESGPVPSLPAITVTEAPPLSLPPLVPDYTPVQPQVPRAQPGQDYPLSRTRSTGGIATKRALELKKRYLLGDPSASSVRKSDSTSRLDVKLQMVQSSISEFQKLLNPAPVTTSFTTVSFMSSIDTKPLTQNAATFERPELPVSDDTPSKLSSSEDTVKERVLDAHEKDALEASKEELDTDTLSEDASSTIGKASKEVPRVEVHNAAGELVQVNEVALELKSEDDDVQSTALTETELSDWAADSAVDDCVPDSVLDKHTRNTNKGPRSLSRPKSVYDSNTAPMHVCGKDSETQPIVFSNALEHFEFADEGEQDLSVAAAVNRGFMELVLDNRTADHDRSMEFIDQSLNAVYIDTNDTDLCECTVTEETPSVVSCTPLESGLSDGPDAEGNYRRKQSLGIENNNEQSLHFNGTNENIRMEYEHTETPTKDFNHSILSMRSGLETQSPACRSLDSSVDVKVQEVKRKKEEETEIVRQLVLGKHGNMNRRNVKKYRRPEWSQLPPPVPPLPYELPPSPPPPPTPTSMPASVSIKPAAVTFGHRVATSASDPDLTKKNNFLKTLLHLPQRIYLRTKDTSWSSSSTHKSTSALSPPPVPSPPLNYRPKDKPRMDHSKRSGFRSSDSGGDQTVVTKDSPSTSGPISSRTLIDSSRMEDPFSSDTAPSNLRLEQIEKKLLKPQKMTAEEQAAAVAMLVEIKAQRDAHQALRAADRQRGAAGAWDCRYK